MPTVNAHEATGQNGFASGATFAAGGAYQPPASLSDSSARRAETASFATESE